MGDRRFSRKSTETPTGVGGGCDGGGVVEVEGVRPNEHPSPLFSRFRFCSDVHFRTFFCS